MKKIVLSITVYFVILSYVIGLAAVGNITATNIAVQAPLDNRKCVIIDAGHGGIDGGATSCTGVLESKINLDIATRLNDLMHLLGISTLMIRTDDRSIYTSGQTIAAQKNSDLKERVRIVNSTDNALLISIHQNHFADSRYDGAQVFYGVHEHSKDLANALQTAIKTHLNPGNNRTVKKAESIYLLENAECTSILLECGFLSNPVEEAKLCSAEYQKKLCCVIAGVISGFLSGT